MTRGGYFLAFSEENLSHHRSGFNLKVSSVLFFQYLFFSLQLIFLFLYYKHNNNNTAKLPCYEVSRGIKKIFVL